MDEMDSLLDSLIQQRKASEVSYVDDKDAKTIKVQNTLTRGEGMIAEKLLSVQNPICSLACPTMMAIDSDYIQTTCYHCLVITATQLPLPSHGHTSIDLKTCNGCQFARFCNRDCQLKAWHAYHKHECKILKKLQGNIPPAFMRAVLRAVLLKDQDKVSSLEWDRIISLNSHEQDFVTRGRSNLTDMAEGIKHLAKTNMSVDMIQRLIFIMKCNATEIPTPIYGGIGVMLEPLVAKANHSCEPNFAIHRPQHTMKSGWIDSTDIPENERKTFIQLIPLRDIQQGEELWNCYIVPTVSVTDRKARLKEEYFFDCTCTKCLSDTQDFTDLKADRPKLPGQFEQWTKNVDRHISQSPQPSDSFKKASIAMDKSEQYLEFPALYTSGVFPELAMKLILEGLKNRVFDESLINILRIYFLVNPTRFVGRHNPTNIYTAFLMLDIFDAILGHSNPSGITPEKREEWLRTLSKDRGLTETSLVYWRNRICADLKRNLQASAARDLLVLVEKGEQLQNTKEEEEEHIGAAEEQMRNALNLKGQRWKAVLQEAGC